MVGVTVVTIVPIVTIVTILIRVILVISSLVDQERVVVALIRVKMN